MEPKSKKNGIKNKSDFKTKTDPRPTTSGGGPGRRGPRWAAPIFAPGLPKELIDEGDRAENDEGTNGKEQKMTNGPKRKRTKGRK